MGNTEPFLPIQVFFKLEFSLFYIKATFLFKIMSSKRILNSIIIAFSVIQLLILIFPKIYLLQHILAKKK